MNLKYAVLMCGASALVFCSAPSWAGFNLENSTTPAPALSKNTGGSSLPVEKVLPVPAAVPATGAPIVPQKAEDVWKIPPKSGPSETVPVSPPPSTPSQNITWSAPPSATPQALPAPRPSQQDSGSAVGEALPVPTGGIVAQPMINKAPLPMQTAPANPAPPALMIYNEKYAPDTVKEKYGLGESWYADKSTAPIPTPDVPKDQMVPEVIPPKTVIVEHPVDSWRARAGESVREILKRWSDREGTELMWASEDVPVLQKDFTYFGRFQDAVNTLLQASSGNRLHSQYRSEGLNPVMMAPASMVTTNVPVPPAPQKTISEKITQLFKPEEPPKIEAPIKPASQETRWFGLAGTKMSDVLGTWAKDDGGRMIWQSEPNFTLKSAISHNGSFEEAVYQALSQYNDEPVRPVGQIYKDPSNGQKVLVIQTDASGQ